jgi:hypothetical protein
MVVGCSMANTSTILRIGEPPDTDKFPRRMSHGR